MKFPSGATAIEISFGPDVSITSGTWDKVGRWTVWDARHVGQGARMIADNLSYRAACEKASEVRREEEP